MEPRKLYAGITKLEIVEMIMNKDGESIKITDIGIKYYDNTIPVYTLNIAHNHSFLQLAI